mmetsp:Transcript_12316/g.36103  ORF Transcript_12316/g.36103 Transcript_12316/m.36103 type:complete len:352 (+) Transcript_12316:109-1164(+)
MAWMYAGHCATRCGLKEHASKSSSRFGARVASRARRDGANNRGLTSSQDRDVWWFRRGLNVSSRARRAASDASTRFVAAWRRAASILDCASAVRAGLAFALAVTSGRNVSRGRGASGGFFASDSRWPENFSLSPLAMRWRRRASRRFWRSSNFELRAILLEFSQSLGLKEHSRGVSFCRASALRARRDESLPCLLTNSWKSIEGPPMVCCFGFGGGGGGGGCWASSTSRSRISPMRACSSREWNQRPLMRVSSSDRRKIKYLSTTSSSKVSSTSSTIFVMLSRFSTTKRTRGCAFRAAMNKGPSTSARSHSWSAPKLYNVACVALANISTMEGSTLLNEFREFVAAWDAAF